MAKKKVFVFVFKYAVMSICIRSLITLFVKSIFETYSKYIADEVGVFSYLDSNTFFEYIFLLHRVHTCGLYVCP